MTNHWDPASSERVPEVGTAGRDSVKPKGSQQVRSKCLNSLTQDLNLHCLLRKSLTPSTSD